MKAREVMTRDVQAILPEAHLVDAWRLMRELQVRHLPVVVGGKLSGLLSDRDFLGWVTRGPDGVPRFDDVTVGSVMTLNPVVSVQGALVSELAKTMLSRQIDCLPIVTPENVLVGLVTSTDLLALLQDARQRLPMEFHVRLSASA